MILPTLKFLADEFSKYVDSKRDQATADAGGSLGLVGNAALLFDAEQESTIKDKVIFTLVNLEEDRASRPPLNLTKRAGAAVYELPPILLNLYVLATATHKKYDEGLGVLGHVIAFFQHNKHFNTSTHPSLPTDIKELSVELYTMNFEQVNHLWSTLGGKYMPSVLYKVRNLSISEHLILGEARRIEEIVVHPGLIARRGGGSP